MKNNQNKYKQKLQIINCLFLLTLGFETCFTEFKSIIKFTWILFYPGDVPKPPISVILHTNIHNSLVFEVLHDVIKYNMTSSNTT